MTLRRQRLVVAIAVAVLAALPVSGPLCAAVCLPAAAGAATAGAHAGHGAQPACHKPAAADVRMAGAPDHDCARHDGADGNARPTVSSARTDLRLVAVAQHLHWSIAHLSGLTPSRALFRPHSPPGIVSPARPPLVLRI